MVIARSLAGMAGTAQMMVMTANRRKTGSLLMRQAAQSPTPIRLRGTRTRPIACLRSSRLRWWSGWHRSVLRGFAGGVWVLLALSAKPPCPSGRCQRIATAMRRKPLMDMSQDLMESPLKKGEANMQPHPLGGLLPTPTHLKGVRSKPTACRRSSLLRWWSGWHRGVLRGFAGGVWVLLALSARRRCPLSRCQRMDIIILSVAQAATVDMQAVHPCSGKIPPPQTPVMLAGGRPIPTR